MKSDVLEKPESKKDVLEKAAALPSPKDGPHAGRAMPAAPAAVAVTQSPELRMVLRKAIERDPAQPRKEFDQAKLEELAESIRALGVQVPLRVEELKGGNRANGAQYKLIDGERRWRACELAGLERVPVLVGPVNEKERLGIQVTLNQQRENLSALEEAEAYARSLREGHKAEELCKSLGVKRATFYARVALTRLDEETLKALREGNILPTVASLVAMVPPGKDREAFLSEVSGNDYRRATSFRDAVEILEEYCKQLKGAPFKLEDKDLVPVEYEVTNGKAAVRVTGQMPKLPAKNEVYMSSRQEDDGQGHQTTVCCVWEGRSYADQVIGEGKTRPVVVDVKPALAKELTLLINGPGAARLSVARVCGGACTDCPRRTGNMPEYPESEKRPNVCTLPSCYQSKVQAHWNGVAAEKGKAGVTVLDAKTYAKNRNEYVPVKQDVWTTGKGGRYQPWKDVVGKNGPKVVLAATEDGLIEVFPKAEAKAAAEKTGARFQAETSSSRVDMVKYEAQRKAKEELRKRRETLLVTSAAPALSPLLEKAKEEMVWELVLEYLDDEYSDDDELELALAKGAKSGKGKVLAKLLAIGERMPVDHDGSWNDAAVKVWRALGVDLLKLEESEKRTVLAQALKQKGKAVSPAPAASATAVQKVAKIAKAARKAWDKAKAKKGGLKRK